MNGHLKEYAMKVAVGVSIAAAGGGWAFLVRIDNRVTDLEATNRVTASEMRSIADDVSEIKTDIRDIPMGDGGMSASEARRLVRMENDLSCIRRFLAGNTRPCP